MPCRTPTRELVLDVLQRLRESEEQAKKCAASGQVMAAERWRARARAFNEIYTEMKGLRMDHGPW